MCSVLNGDITCEYEITIPDDIMESGMDYGVTDYCIVFCRGFSKLVNGMIMDHTKEQGILQFLFRASKEVSMNIGEMTDENNIQDKYTLYVKYYKRNINITEE